MYEVILTATVSDGEETAVLQRTVKLPFAPYAGLWLHGLLPEEDLDTGSVEVSEVIWSVGESTFYVRLSEDVPDDEEESGESDPTVRMQAAIDAYGSDWEVIERYRDDAE